jgi:hypothetical protein
MLRVIGAEIKEDSTRRVHAASTRQRPTRQLVDQLTLNAYHEAMQAGRARQGGHQ